MTHADFYVASATVIPVLMLATTLQGRFYRTYWSALLRRRFYPKALAARTRGTVPPGARQLVSVLVLLGLGIAVSAEWTAVQALRDLRDTAGRRGIVSDGLGLLLLINAVGAGLQILPYMFERQQSSQGDDPPSGQ